MENERVYQIKLFKFELPITLSLNLFLYLFLFKRKLFYDLLLLNRVCVAVCIRILSFNCINVQKLEGRCMFGSIYGQSSFQKLKHRYSSLLLYICNMLYIYIFVFDIKKCFFYYFFIMVIFFLIYSIYYMFSIYL